MNQLICPSCEKISYTADTFQTQKCPYCTEKYLIVNNDFMDLLKAYNSGNLKLVVNRRRVERRMFNISVINDRRNSDRRGNNVTPIGWLTARPHAAR